MERYKFTPVTISREEYDKYRSAMLIVNNAISNCKLNSNGTVPDYVCVRGELLQTLFPDRVSECEIKGGLKNEEN